MNFSEKKPRFLVVRTDKIGDTVLSIPVAEFLKKLFPKSYIGVLIKPYTAPLFENNPFVDKIITDDRYGKHSGISGFWNLVSDISKEKFDAALLLFSTPRAASIIKFSVPYSVGPASKIEQFLYNKRIRQKRSRCEKNEAAYNLDIAYEYVRSLGVDVNIPTHMWPKIYVTEKEKERTRGILKEMGINSGDKLVVVHPGSGGSAKNWLPEEYGIICDEIKSRLGAHVVITMGKGEDYIIRRLNKSAIKHHLPFAQKTLRDLAGLLERADVVFTSSTGPLHIAAAVGTRTVSIFCPIRVCLPKRWGPQGYEGQHRIFSPEVPVCEKCTESKCSYFNCMKSISHEDVLEGIKLALQEKAY